MTCDCGKSGWHVTGPQCTPDATWDYVGSASPAVEGAKGEYRVVKDSGTKYYVFIKDGSGKIIETFSQDMTRIAYDVCEHMNAAFAAGIAAERERVAKALEHHSRRADRLRRIVDDIFKTPSDAMLLAHAAILTDDAVLRGDFDAARDKAKESK